MTKIEKQIRGGLPMVGYAPYGQVHAHSTGNPSSTAQNEADYMNRKDINSGFYTHVVGNGRIIQVANVNRGAWDVGGEFNQWGYASVELIESHKNKAEFERDYKIYINLLRDLAKEAGIPIKVDSGNMGILSHAYCTANQPSNGSDHIDPYPYLAKWGVSKAQFKKDIENGVSGLSPKPTQKPNKKSTYHKDGNRYYTVKTDKLGIYRNKDLTGKYTGGWFARGSKIWVGEVNVTSSGATRGKNPTGWISLNTDLVK